ncbi:MAG: cobalt-precorrin-5B (C(1))-methyltransferase, partial [Methanosarcinales archaeon]|nr:cobalt-precorrin-5B (C(1))-methyltransferase [Methanosarcinales archaeon]
RCQIIDAILEALDECRLEGAAVTISAPDGEAVAALTLNQKVGVEGGISILGTTGFVEPWNDHLGETKMEVISEASGVVLTTGRIGMRYSQILFPEYTSVMVGSRLDEGIQAAIGETIICGLPGLILKWAVPDILEGTGFNTVQEMIDNNKENPLIYTSLAEVGEKSNSARIVVVDRDGNIIRDTGDMA